MVKRRICRLVRKIPRGKVSTYGRIAAHLNLKSPRLVGQILHQNNDPKKTPCHRVVFADGSFSSQYAFGGKIEQRKKLKEEGVIFLANGKVDLSTCLARQSRID